MSNPIHPSIAANALPKEGTQIFFPDGSSTAAPHPHARPGYIPSRYIKQEISIGSATGTVAQIQRRLRQDNKAFGSAMQPIPLPDRHPSVKAPATHAWRSRHFLACLYIEPQGEPYERLLPAKRLSINRTELDRAGEFKDGITWDELMAVKSQCGFGESWATEIYPANAEVVNVANIRHLWILDGPPQQAWMKSGGK